MVAAARLRRRLVAAAVLAAVGLGVAAPAHAWSSLNSLAGPNAWIVADLAAQGGTTLVDSRTTPGALDETFTVRAESPDARRAPTRVAKSAGWLSKVPGLGKFGAILDGGSVLLDLGGFSFGGDSWRVGEGAPSSAPPNGQVLALPWSQHGFTGVSTFTRTGARSFDLVRQDQTYVDQGRTDTRVRYGGRCSSGTLAGSWVPLGAVFDTQPNAQYVPVQRTAPGYQPSIDGSQWGGGTCLRVSDLAVGDFNTVGTAPGPDWPRATATPAPSRLTSRVECRSSTGETVPVTSSVDVPIGPGLDVAPPDARCPDGTVAVSGSVTATAPDGTLSELVSPVQAPAWVGTIPVQAPGCTVTGAACSLDLETLLEDGTWVSCGLRPDLCTEWETAPAQTPARFRCTYGREVVDVGRCSGIVVQPDNAESPLQVDYPLPRPATAPAPVPTRPSTQVQPPVPRPVPEGAECRATLVIFGGVLCALQEAFIPSRATLAGQTAQLLAMLREKPPSSLMFDLAPALGALPDAYRAGCAQFPDFSPAQDGSLQLPCSIPDSPAVDVMRFVASLGLVVGTAFALWRMVAASFGGKGGVE